jgi:DNA-binding response OmpR family regulator
MDKRKILLTEDELFLSSLLQMKLEQEGFQVQRAKDGEEAMQMLETFIPDLMLLDLILPKKNGFEVLESLRQDPRFQKIPVIIISMLGQDTDIARGKSLGVIDYIVKARLSVDELVNKVKDKVKTSIETVANSPIPPPIVGVSEPATPLPVAAVPNPTPTTPPVPQVPPIPSVPPAVPPAGNPPIQ